MIDLEQVLPVEDVRELELSGPFEEIRKFEDGIKLGHRYEGETILEFDATEVERFKEVIELFESLDDEEIGIQTELISKKLPNFFSGLRAVDDDEFHGEGTLMDHTLTVLVGLNTDGLSRSSKKIIRTAALFHDMGKLVSMDAEHPRHSELLSREFLSQLNLDENELALLLRQIKYHEALGDISRRDGFSIWRPADLATFFKDCEELELHRRLVISDIGSIPSLRKYLPSVNSTYNRLVKQISVEGWKYLGSESLEFCDYGELLELRKKLYTDRDVDLIDVVEDMAWRRDLFKTVLTDEERRKVEDYIVHGSKAFDEGYMLAMQIAGIETNLGEIHNLGEKYKVSLEEAEMTLHSHLKCTRIVNL